LATWDILLPRVAKVRPMADEKKRPDIPDRTTEHVRSLALETGVTEEQIRYIISMVGYDRSSIVREARILRGVARS